MKNLGMFKTALGKTYVCHLDEENGKVITFGPLPEMRPWTVEAADAEEAAKKISGEVGYGLMIPPA